jgi:hypothetical protein
MTKTIRKLGALGITLFTMAFTPFAKAGQWDKTTLITAREPIQIQGQVLQPGEHLMRLLNTTDRRILSIYDADGSKLVMTVMALPAYRLEPTGDTQFTFSEVSPGGAPALHTWFYPGDHFGLEFAVKH